MLTFVCRSFFELWYDKQTQELRDAMRKIVDNGQLEFVAGVSLFLLSLCSHHFIGGWVQNDEANANFDIVIDQVMFEPQHPHKKGKHLCLSSSRIHEILL